MSSNTAGSRGGSRQNAPLPDNSQSLARVMQEKDDLVRVVGSLALKVRDLEGTINSLTQERDNANGQARHLQLTLNQVMKEKDAKVNELNARVDAERALRIAAEEMIQQLRAELRTAVPAFTTGKEGVGLVTGSTSLRMNNPEGMDSFNRKLSAHMYTTYKPMSRAEPQAFNPERKIKEERDEAGMDVDEKPMAAESSGYSRYVVSRSDTPAQAQAPPAPQNAAGARTAYGSFDGVRRAKPSKMNKDEFIDKRVDGSWEPPDGYNGDKVCLDFVSYRGCTREVCRRFHPREEDKPKLQDLKYY